MYGFALRISGSVLYNFIYQGRYGTFEELISCEVGFVEVCRETEVAGL